MKKKFIRFLSSRIKNYGLWLAVAALGFKLLQDTGVKITSEQYQGYVNLILNIAFLLGFINNPTTENRGFFDDSIKISEEEGA